MVRCTLGDVGVFFFFFFFFFFFVGLDSDKLQLFVDLGRIV